MRRYLFAVGTVAVVLSSASAFAVDLYTENFEVDPSANWASFVSPGADPTDSAANYFFDYGSVGIPIAPHSVGSSTRGMTLQTNINNSGLPAFEGMSASPVGKDFSANASYAVTFDWWANSIGPFPGGGSGSTQLSTFGVGTAGATAQWPGGPNDSVFFGSVGDANTTSDWRAYSTSAAGQFSYQEPNPSSVPPLPDGRGVYASYNSDPANAITVRNSNHPYYASFVGQTPPAAQTTLFPSQTGTTVVGASAFMWHAVEIAKNDGVITWKVDNKLIATVDTTAEAITLGGGNIFFGMSDINAGASADANRTSLLFTLIDNIKVATITAPPANTADFNGDHIVNAADYTIWRDHLGLTGTATQATGDANGDLSVTSADYDAWKLQFGTTPGSGSLSASAAPEPGSLLLFVCGLIAVAMGRRQGR